MRVERLRIDGFGRFHDEDLGPFPNRVTVFFGPNEAGKSTLLAFIRAMLFGFPLRGARSHYPPVAGGRHGGRLSIADSAGQIHLVKRFQGTHGGPVNVSLETGEPVGEAILNQLLGSHTRDVFNEIFAFTIDELHSDALLKDSSVNSQMYSTGIGASALPDALTEIDGARNDLFRNRGSTQKIYDVVKKIEQIDGKLASAANNASEYGRHRVRLSHIAEEIEEFGNRQAKIQEEQRIQSQLRNAWSDWVELLATEEELVGVPEIENFPPDGLDRLNRLADQARTAREEQRSALERVTAFEARLEAAVPNIEILRYSDDIDEIVRQRGAFDQSVHDLPERRAELGNDRNALEEILSDLGTDWDEDRLDNFDVSMSVREEIQGFHNDLLRATETFERQSYASKTDASTLKEVEEDIERQLDIVKRAEKPQFTETEIRERRSLIRRALTTFGDLNRAQERVSDFEFRTANSSEPSEDSGARRSSNLLSWVLIACGITLVIASVALAGGAMSIGVLGGVILAGFGVQRLYANRSENPTSTVADNSNLEYAKTLIDEVEKRQCQINEFARKVDISTIDPAALNALDDELDEEQAGLSEWNVNNRRLCDLRSLKKRRELALAASNRALENSAKSKESIEAAWSDWIHERRLNETFTPETVIELRAKVDQGKDRLKTVRERQSRIGAIETDIRQFFGIVEPVAVEFGIEVGRGSHASVTLAADKLIELRTNVENKVRERDSTKQEFVEAKANLRVRKTNLNDIETEVDELMKTGGAQDEEDFRRRHEHVGLRTQLESQRRGSIKRLQRLSAPGGPFEILKSRLTATDAESIDREIQHLEERKIETEAQIKELYEERGALETQIESLAGEEESSRLRMERHVLREQVSDYTRQWAIYTVAKNLLMATRRDFERERQPRVLKHAESYFRDITDGRYSTIYAPLGEQKITVNDRDGSSKAPSDLSRGTREQLFLSLRFGLIKELGEQTEPLPVIVDEVMVNFDPRRASLAASAFVKLSESNQVLVFTCHPTTVEVFQAAAKQHSVKEFDVIELG